MSQTAPLVGDDDDAGDVQDDPWESSRQNRRKGDPQTEPGYFDPEIFRKPTSHAGNHAV